MPAVGKSGPGTSRIRSREAELGVVDQRDAGVDDLAEIVRRDVGRHADRDAGRAVDQQVRDPRRQHRRFVFAAVVVRREIDRFLVDVGQQLVREARHAHFGVAHRRRGVAVDRAEVALPVHQQVAQRERLRHAHDRVVHRRVAVRVVLADDVADDARRLLVRLVPVVAELAHREQHAPVHRLQAVADIGQRAAHDHAHRVIEVGLAHLVFEVDVQDFARDLAHADFVDFSGPKEAANFNTARILHGCKTARTWTLRRSRNSTPRRRAGGTRTASFGRCTTSIPPGSITSRRVPALRAGGSSTSVAAAASWPRAWRAGVPG